MTSSDRINRIPIQYDPNLDDYQQTGIVNPEALTGIDDKSEGHAEAARKRAAHYALLVLFSMVGCLIRLGLDALGAYDGQIVFELAWAQGVGCAIMGLALHKKDEITRIYPPLYTAITTGLAGSVTSFSAWMLGGYLSFSNSSRYSRGGFYDTVDGVAYTFATLALSLGCLYFGEHVSRCLPSLPSPKLHQNLISSKGDPDKLPTSSSPRSKSTGHYLHPRAIMILDYLVFTSAILSYLIALLLYFLGPTTWRHRATFPILLAPPGAILRFYLAEFNSKSPFSGRFPLGTFIANIGGSLLMGGVYAAQYLPPTQGNSIRCNALWAIQQGFCGCLTTVSTFMVESRSIKGKRWTWIYVGSSIVLGHLAILITFGVSKWAGRLDGSICSA